MTKQSKAAFIAALPTIIDDNTTGNITPTDHRTVETNMSDSVLWYEGCDALTAVTVATDDKVVIRDTSDSDNLKTVTTQSIADLATTSGMLKKTVTVSSAQLQSLFTTPVEIIAAQGAGTLINPFRAIASLDFNSVAYTSQALTLKWGGTTSINLGSAITSEQQIRFQSAHRRQTPPIPT